MTAAASTTYLQALAQARTALDREELAVLAGAASLQSTSDALSRLRAARQEYCSRRHATSEGSGVT